MAPTTTETTTTTPLRGVTSSDMARRSVRAERAALGRIDDDDRWGA